MKYIDADKIRTEIKRLKAENNCGTDEFIAAKDIAYDKVFDFLENLEEPVTDCHDLTEAAEAYSRQVSRGHNYRDLTCGFIAGAEWQKKQIPMPEDTVIFQNGVEEGKRLMMEGAVEGVVWGNAGKNINIGVPKGVCKYIEQDETYKIRIIIVKEDTGNESALH